MKIRSCISFLSHPNSSIDLLPARSPLFDWRGAVTLLEIGQNYGEDELLFAVVVPLNYNVLISARHHSAKTELRMLNLSTLVEGGFCSHLRTSKYKITNPVRIVEEH